MSFWPLLFDARGGYPLQQVIRGRSQEKPMYCLREHRPWCLRRFDQLDVESDAHILSDEDATGFEGGIPGETKIFAVNLGGGGEADACVAPGIFRRLADVFDGQDHRLGDITDGEVSRDCKAVALAFNVRGFEGHGREFFCVEEVGTLKMAVALRIECIDGADVNGDFKSGASVVGFKAV